MFDRYLNPRNDLAFRKVFGDEKRKTIPIDFLNAVLQLEGENKIVTLDFLNLYQSPEIEARKVSLVDVIVRDQKETEYIIQIHVSKIEGFKEKARYYAARTYCSHFRKGGKYERLNKVVFLAILDQVFFPEKERFKDNYRILDDKGRKLIFEHFTFTFVELSKFNKTIDQLVSIEDKWCYFLKHGDESKDVERFLSKHREIKEAYEVLDRYHWTESEIQEYERLMMNDADQYGIIQAALKDWGKEKSY